MYNLAICEIRYITNIITFSIFFLFLVAKQKEKENPEEKRERAEGGTVKVMNLAV